MSGNSKLIIILGINVVVPEGSHHLLFSDAEQNRSRMLTVLASLPELCGFDRTLELRSFSPPTRLPQVLLQPLLRQLLGRALTMAACTSLKMLPCHWVVIGDSETLGPV